MKHEEPGMEVEKTSFAGHPTLQYAVLAALGAFGIYISMPIYFSPQSTLEWIDLGINLLIFIPCSVVTVGGALLTILSGVFSYQIDEKGRFASFARTVLTAFGMPKLLIPDFVALSPLGLLGALFSRRYSGREISEASVPRGDGDAQR